MFRRVSTCSYSNYRKESVKLCDNPEQYHCLQNEFQQSGWLCTDPIWIEEDYACQEHSISSSQIYTHYENSTQETHHSTTTSTPSTTLYVGIAVSTFVIIFLLICLRVLLHKRTKYSDMKKAKDEGENLVEENTERRSKQNTYETANSYLQDNRCVILVGTQGAGKTFIAEKLANEWKLQYIQIGEQTKKSVGNVRHITDINSVTDLKPDGRILLVIDGLLTDSKTKEYVDYVVEKLNSLYNHFITSNTMYIIITVSNILWKTCANNFNKCQLCQQCDADVTDLSDIERKDILNNYMSYITECSTDSRHNLVTSTSLPEDENNPRITRQTMDMVVTKRDYNIIGYPSIIALMLKNGRLMERLTFYVQSPVSGIRKDMKDIVSSTLEATQYKCLSLSYMALCGGYLNKRHLDLRLLNNLAKLLSLKYKEDELMRALESLQREYIKKDEEQYYFENNVVYRIFFAIIGKKWSDFVTENCNIDMLLDWTCIDDEFLSEFETDYRQVYFRKPNMSIMASRYAELHEDQLKFNRNLRNMKFKDLYSNKREENEKYFIELNDIAM